MGCASLAPPLNPPMQSVNFIGYLLKSRLNSRESRLSTNGNIIAGRDFCHISFIGRHLFCFKNAITGQFLGVNGLNCYYCENCPEPFDTDDNRVTTTHCGDASPRCSVSNQ